MSQAVAWELEIHLDYRLEKGETGGELHELHDIEQRLDEFEIGDQGYSLPDVLTYRGEYLSNEPEPVNSFTYSPLEDVCRFSRGFPNALFTLTATHCEHISGPDDPICFRHYVVDGLAQYASAVVSFEPFYEERLR